MRWFPRYRRTTSVYIDAFLGARKADQQGPISPYLGYSKEEEARTQRKIFRYWRDREVDVASEYVFGIRVDRFVGLQPHSAAQGDEIEDLPDELYCSNPAHFGFTSETEPEEFQEKFWLTFLPWFYKNNSKGTEDPQFMINGTDICAPCLWCDEPTLVAYSKDGYKNKTWMLPTDWSQVDRVSLSTIYGDGDEPLGEKEVDGIHISLALRKNQVLRIRPSGQ